MTTIPIVIFHTGNQEYFKCCVKLNSIKNKVYLIGDESNMNIFDDNKNIKHFNLSNLHLDEIKVFTDHFVNYSTCPAHAEMLCFIRLFYVKKLMELEKIEKICHLDSDCILLDNTNELFKNIHDCAYLITDRNYTENKNICNSGSVHSSLLTIDFLNKFIELCLDIYVNKSKFYLIEPKIHFFKNNYLQGGVCDMTLYYLLYSEKCIPVINLYNIFQLNNEYATFDDNINDSEGCYGNSTFTMKNKKKDLIFKDNKIYVEDSKKT